MARPEQQLEVRILGPLEVSSGGQRVAAGGRKQREVLAVLAIRAGEAVSSDALIDALWPDEPPPTALTTLQVYVSRLRKLLGADAIISEGGGYRLVLDGDGLDAARFERFAAAAGVSQTVGRLDDAEKAIVTALSLWRGPALVDFAYEPWAQPEITRLEERRLACVEERFELELALGRHTEVVADLQRLVQEHPLRERLRGQLMVALYRSGRQAEALATYQDARAKLVDELGIEPGRELQGLNRQILNQSEDLAGRPPPPGRNGQLASQEVVPPVRLDVDQPAPAPTQRIRVGVEPRRTRLRTPYAVGGIAITAVIVVFALLSVRSDPAPLIAKPNTVAVIDAARNKLVEVVDVGTTPTTLVAGGGRVWALNTGDQTISMIDVGSRKVVRAIPAGAIASDLAFAAGSIWVADAQANTVRVLDEAGGITATIPLSIRHRRSTFVPPRVVLAAGDGKVWATGGDLSSVVVDAATRRVVRENPGYGDVWADRTPAGPDIAIGDAGVWATDGRDELYRLDVTPAERVQLGGLGGDEGIGGVSVGPDDVWAAGTESVWRVRAQPASPDRTFSVGRGPSAVAVGAGAVWTTDAFDGTVTRVDPESGRTTTIKVGGAPNDLIVVGDQVWITID